jgi:hypothetical protein
LVSGRRGRNVERMSIRDADPMRQLTVPARQTRRSFVVTRRATTLTAVILAIVPVGTATASSTHTSYASVALECRHECTLDGEPVIETDARHAALVRRAGAIPLVLQPRTGSDAEGPGLPQNSTVHPQYLTDVGVGAGTALLILAGGAALLGRGRKPVTT